ncbi:hypothetical protein BCEP4_1140069 [Burkholderia cepacia]|nr:hypothetical protein BCEP4_1140069 [Burkholderia cepacia]
MRYVQGCVPCAAGANFCWRFGDNRSFRPVCHDWQGSDYLQVCLQKHSFLGDRFGDRCRD